MIELNDDDEESIGSESNGSDLAIGDESSNKAQLSIQQLQSIYHELTGKSENVGRSYFKAIQVEFSDLEQLHRKIEQACEQYHIATNNFSARIYYVDDTHDVFSSFDRFKLHNSGSSSSVESVLIQYNFLIQLPKTRRVQTYKLSVRLASRIAITKRMNSDFFGRIPKIFKVMGNRTAIVDIEYIDYMVARNLLSVVDDWFKLIPVAPEWTLINALQSYSEFFAPVARFFTTLFVALVAIQFLPIFVKRDTADLLGFGYFLGFSLLVIYAAYTLTDWFARILEAAIDSYRGISYLKFTNGDASEIKNARKSNLETCVKALCGLTSTILVPIVIKIAATICADWLILR